MHCESNYPHPSISQIPFRQLTYLEYCMMPQLFEQYVNSLGIQIETIVIESDYQKMGDLFILYAQTLFELIPMPLGEDRITSRLKFMEASALGGQLMRLLKYIMRKMEVESIEAIFSRNVPNCIYNQLSLQLFQEQKCNGMKDQREEDIHRAYLGSLNNYFKMLGIQDDIRKGRKFINNLILQKEIEQISLNYTQSLSSHEKGPKRYRKYFQKYRGLTQMLKYVFKSSQTKQKNGSESNDMDIEPFRLRPKASSNHISIFYSKCLSPRQKLLLIKNEYDSLLKKGIIDYKSVQGIELMCLLYLQQMKASKIGSKLEVYLLLTSIKIYKNSSPAGLLDQLKILFSFDQLPNISFIFPLISSIISTQNPDSSTSQILDFILKSYSKTHSNNDKNYVRLVLISSLYLHYKIGVVKSTSRKLQLEKLCEFSDVIGYFNNLELVDYFVDLAWSGKEMRVFGDGKGRELEGLGMVFGVKDAEVYFKEYLIKSGGQQGQDLPPQKIEALLQTLLQKRTSLTSPASPNEYFHNHLLTLLLQTSNCTNFTPKTTQACLQILQEYSIIGTYQPINEKIVRLIFFILVFSLGRHKREALFCYLLSVGVQRVNWEKVQGFVRGNAEEFCRVDAELFDTILSYDFVEILVENFKEIYYEKMNEWIVKTENYLYTWPDTKKEKILMVKRARLINYLVRKFSQVE